MNLFQLGDFTLASGKKSKWKIDCDALTNEDIETIALLIAKIVGPFSSVSGVPTGGLRLAEAMNNYATPGGYRKPHLIVDDVFTTGKSIMKWRGRYIKDDVMGAVIFARGPVFPWVKALFTMPREFWVNNG